MIHSHYHINTNWDRVIHSIFDSNPVPITHMVRSATYFGEELDYLNDEVEFGRDDISDSNWLYTFTQGPDDTDLNDTGLNDTEDILNYSIRIR